MFHPKLQLPREIIEVRCCGAIYKRWRIVGEEWPTARVTHCLHCGVRLKYQRFTRDNPMPRKPLNKKQLFRRRAQWRVNQQNYRDKNIPALLAAGLTTRGTPRKNREYPQFAHLHGRARKNAVQKLRRDEKRPSPLSPIEQSWRELRAGMTISMPQISTHSGTRWENS